MKRDSVRLQLLGPVEVAVEGDPRGLQGQRRKSILAVLGLAAGSVVSTDRLIDAVWDSRPPATAGNTLQSHVSYLRGVLGDRTVIVSRTAGYLLDVTADAVDAVRAELLIRRDGLPEDHAANATRLRTALDLWHGQPLSDVSDTPWRRDQSGRLESLRLDAVTGLVEARLALGEHERLIPELERLAAEYPFRERLHGQLMLALYRSGRQADALAVIQRLRYGIATELGLDPSPELRELEAAILRQDRALSLAAATERIAPGGGRVAPAHLPLALATFSGRDTEIAALDAILKAAGDTLTATLALIWGTAGVGKTTLALRWAHQIASRFPDGQLHVNLRGFDPAGAALSPADALWALLEALGVPPAGIPSDVDGRASLYRGALAGRRVLVVLDNARDEEQVRPLLPGSAEVFVLITSRTRLTGLVAAEGAHPLAVDLPDPAQARQILARRLGVARVAAEPAAVDEIIDRCARLPLALAVAAAHAAASTLPLAALADELRAAGTGLDSFPTPDAPTDVRAVLACSYRMLSGPAARLFRWLSLGRGPDVSLDAAASLVGVAQPVARRLLAELVRANLVTEPVPARYALHDLLRAFAIDLTVAHDRPAETGPAQWRLLNHYLYTAYAAATVLDPGRALPPVEPAQPGITTTKLGGVEEAVAWFVAENAALLAAVNTRIAGGDWRGWRLARAMCSLLDRRGQWQDLVLVHLRALADAQRLGDEAGQAQCHVVLGPANAKLGRFTDADQHLRRALDLYQQLGDRAAVGRVLMALSYCDNARGEHASGLRYSLQALRLFREIDLPAGQATALNTMGLCCAHLGRYAAGRRHLSRALAIHTTSGDRVGHANALDTLGYLYARLGDHAAAMASFRAAVSMFEECGVPYLAAETLTRLGDAHAACGERDAARLAWSQADVIYTRLGCAAEAATARARLLEDAVPVAAATDRR